MAETTEEKRNWWGRLQQAVTRTREQFTERIDDIVLGKKEIDREVLEDLEAVLLQSDLGVETTAEVLERLRERRERHELADPAALRDALKSELTAIVRTENNNRPASSTKPRVVFLVGVNGTGKTTTIAKLARRWQAEGKSVVLCAADTFRAAASEQLEIWAGRLNAHLVSQKPGADPAAVVHDALSAALAREADLVLVDTAGRLHTKSNLMKELGKMSRIAGRLVEGAPHETLLVLDATTGQNGLQQARQFTESAGVTGIVLTKLDGTAKGGIAIAIARELRLPICYLGVGEQAGDLLDFDPEAYVASLFQ